MSASSLWFWAYVAKTGSGVHDMRQEKMGRIAASPPLHGYCATFTCRSTDSAAAHAWRSRPVPDAGGRHEEWIGCCLERFLPLARRVSGSDAAAEDAFHDTWIIAIDKVQQ